MKSHQQHNLSIPLTLIFLALLMTSSLSAQTRSETIDWINSKAPTNPIVYGSIFKESKKFRISADGSFQITATIYETPIDTKHPKAETITSLKGHFKNFSTSSIQVRVENRLIFISINCFNNSGCIQISQTEKPSVSYDNIGVTFGPYYNDEENLPERLKKAFTHLIVQCGGKKEVF